MRTAGYGIPPQPPSLPRPRSRISSTSRLPTSIPLCRPIPRARQRSPQPIDLLIFADQFSYLRAHGAGGSFGTVAVGGLLVQGTVGKGLVEFDQKAVDDETGVYNYTGNSDADVVASAGGTLKGNVISVIADYSDDLFVDSTAAGGGAISLSGSVSVLENYVRTSAEVADSANIDATTFNMTSTQTQDNDYNADSYSIAWRQALAPWRS